MFAWQDYVNKYLVQAYTTPDIGVSYLNHAHMT